eukprot:scaffold2858_cov659-Pavlova_lutheri.AAC.4
MYYVCARLRKEQVQRLSFDLGLCFQAMPTMWLDRRCSVLVESKRCRVSTRIVLASSIGEFRNASSQPRARTERTEENIKGK